MTTTALTRENENCYREPDREDGKGFGFYRYMIRMDVVVPRVRLLARNRSDGELDMSKMWADESAHHDAIRAGKEPPKVAPSRVPPTDAQRIEYQLHGPVQLQAKRQWGFISEHGTRSTHDPVWINIYNAKEAHGAIHGIEADEYSRETAFHISIFLTDERMAWLMGQLERRPDAELVVRLEFTAFQYEVDQRLCEPWQMQTFYFDKRPHVITGVTFCISDPEIMALPQTVGDEPAAGQETKRSRADVVVHDKLLKRLVNGVGWVIALLVAIIGVLLLNGSHQ